MSITVTEATLTDIIDSALDATVAEKIINAAVDSLNIFNCNIPRLNGNSPGSQTASWTSKQLGAVLAVFRVVYASYYKNPSNTQAHISSLGVTVNDLMSNGVVWKMIMDIAAQFSTNPLNTSRSFVRA